MFIERPPLLFRLLYPSALWRIEKQERTVFLTFDDGPIPEATPWILDTLDKYGVKATFFMVGDNARKYPHLHQEVVRRGHRIGNHTYHHLQGFKHSVEKYLKDTEEANKILRTNLFRPPHGHMTTAQYKHLQKSYTVVMWDLVTRDYSNRLSEQEILENVKRYTRSGSIITFHDSLKSIEKLHYALPRAIEWLQAEGYTCKLIP